jgi:hypothetical protein
MRVAVSRRSIGTRRCLEKDRTKRSSGGYLVVKLRYGVTCGLITVSSLDAFDGIMVLG